jgi:hypothetical protein
MIPYDLGDQSGTTAGHIAGRGFEQGNRQISPQFGPLSVVPSPHALVDLQLTSPIGLFLTTFQLSPSSEA